MLSASIFFTVFGILSDIVFTWWKYFKVHRKGSHFHCRTVTQKQGLYVIETIRVLTEDLPQAFLQMEVIRAGRGSIDNSLSICSSLISAWIVLYKSYKAFDKLDGFWYSILYVIVINFLIPLTYFIIHISIFFLFSQGF